MMYNRKTGNTSLEDAMPVFFVVWGLGVVVVMNISCLNLLEKHGNESSLVLTSNLSQEIAQVVA